jgi:hypothetical protein
MVAEPPLGGAVAVMVACTAGAAELKAENTCGPVASPSRGTVEARPFTSV